MYKFEGFFQFHGEGLIKTLPFKMKVYLKKNFFRVIELTPKVLRPTFCSFLIFGQAILVRV